MGVRTIQQAITAGNDFDGSAPAGSVVRGSDIEAYPAAATGGLFDFGNANPLEVFQISIRLGGQTTWTLSVVDIDAVETVAWSGTTEASFVTLAGDRFLLLEGQTLKLVTSGASTAMRARISAQTLD